MIRTAIITSLFCLPVFASSINCGGGDSGDDESFATYQACWDEHHTVENFSVQRAIEICCIDHPIGTAAANTVCGDTTATCITYVTANLDPSDAMATDISTACGDYPADSGRTPS